MKPRKQQSKEQAGPPGGGKGRRENVRGSDAYPAAGPWPERQAVPGSEGERGDQKRGSVTTTTKSDPIRHTQNVKRMMRDVMNHLRDDVHVIDEPKALALFETSAEVLGGLIRAFDHYEKKNEEAWQK